MSSGILGGKDIQYGTGTVLHERDGRYALHAVDGVRRFQTYQDRKGAGKWYKRSIWSHNVRYEIWNG